MSLRSTRFAPLVLTAAVLAACGGGSDPSAGQAASSAGQTTRPGTLRLGYFANITHATALYGVESGSFARVLGNNITLQPRTFNAGPTVVEAIFSRALDAAYTGPNPAINAHAKSKGSAIRIIAGATSGGASLVVKPEISGAADLKGKKVATPQLGNTQDVALRAWLLEQGMRTDVQGGGDVSIVPQENAQTLETFRQGLIGGAWVPEPWATRLIQEGGGKVLVDERSLWPGGQFVTTHLIVRTEFLKQRPEVVKKLLEAHVEATAFVTTNGTEAQRIANAGIKKATTKALTAETISAAWANLTFAVDPIAPSLRKSADDATMAGLIKPVDLAGIYDVTLLNEVLTAYGQKAVAA